MAYTLQVEPEKQEDKDEQKEDAEADADKPSANIPRASMTNVTKRILGSAEGEGHIARPKITTKEDASQVVAEEKNPRSVHRTKPATILLKRSASVGRTFETEEHRKRMEEERQRVAHEIEERKEREREQREEEKERKRRERELRIELEKERWEEEKQLRAEEARQRKEDAAFKREQEIKRRNQQQQNIDDATSIKPYSDEERNSIKAQLDNAFKERFTGMLASDGKFDFDAASIGGPSQVNY